MSPLAMALLLIVTLSAFAFSARRRWRLLRVARRPDPRWDRLGERIGGVLTYVFGQVRMPRYPLAGWAHIVVFFGFMVLLLNSIMLWVRGFALPAAGGHDGFTAYNLWIFGLTSPLGLIYALLRDIFTVFVILGVLAFFYNRVIARLPRLTLNIEGLLILGIIFTMMVADLLYEGGELVHRARAAGSSDVTHAALPFGSLFALWMRRLPESGLNALWQVGFWTHSALVLLFLNLLPYGKHFHVLTVVPNVFFRPLTPRGRLAPVADIEGKLEREEPLGVRRAADLSWKDVLDFYTCTECGRCSDQCPATRTGKKLSPKHYLIAQRDHMYLREKQLVRHARLEAGQQNEGGSQAGMPPREGASEAGMPQAPQTPHGTRDRTPGTGDDDARVALPVDEFVPAWINPEVLWACTSCAACEEECPVLITYIDKIVAMRRHLVMERGEVSEQLQTMFRGLETVGNPYSYPPDQRAEWAAGLDVPLMSEKGSAEYLYWVGCAASFDDRSRKIARALAQLLKAAGVDFAILGPEETCNGDPARRAGNEFLFQTLAQQNVETLNRYGVKKIVTACPHCYNTLKNEYPDFGGRFEVVHHSELLAELIRTGRLRPQRPAGAVVYHDACYLGRHNGVCDAPREVLAAAGLRLAEVPQSRDRGMCCGAGGAQMWKEEEPGRQRVNHARLAQLLPALDGSQPEPRSVSERVGAEPRPESEPRPAGSGGDRRTIATACPFCKTMLSDALADQGHEGIEQLDLAEILWQAVQPAEETAPARAG